MKCRVLVPVAIALLALTLNGCNKAPNSEPPKTTPPSVKEQTAPPPQPTAAQAPTTQPPAVVAAARSTNVLIFRNARSWNRNPDFEEALSALGFKYDVKLSAEIGATDLTPYAFVIIPGAQWKDDYYHQYAEHNALFDRYVTNGGTLVLELNGAERDGITLPRGVTMERNGARDNALALPKHPILDPLGGNPIHANFASHGYLANVPKDALILATEMADGQPLPDRPTFIEYSHGAGRVIAAAQCFHDRDGSGRGILMETTIIYAAEKQWYALRK